MRSLAKLAHLLFPILSGSCRLWILLATVLQIQTYIPAGLSKGRCPTARSICPFFARPVRWITRPFPSAISTIKNGAFPLEESPAAEILVLCFLLEGDSEWPAGTFLAYQNLPWGETEMFPIGLICWNAASFRSWQRWYSSSPPVPVTAILHPGHTFDPHRHIL